MGADLYIHQLYDPTKERYKPLFEKAVMQRDSFPRDSKEWKVAQRKVWKYFDLMNSKGYFRDSYSTANVLRTLGLSWWRNVIPLLNKKNELEGKNLKKFRKMVANAKQRLPTKAELQKDGARGKRSGANRLKMWRKYYIRKRARLIAFLDEAIKRNHSIHCSL